LCSHLDLDITRFILTRVESIKTLEYLERYQGHASLLANRDRGLSEPDFTPVFISHEQYRRMFGDREIRAPDPALIPEVLIWMAAATECTTILQLTRRIEHTCAVITIFVAPSAQWLVCRPLYNNND
jgi:hypothetical protein